MIHVLFCLRAFLLLFCLAWPSLVMAGEYDFAIPEAEEKPYELGGRVELRQVRHFLNQDSVRYFLNHYESDPGPTIDDFNPQVEFEGSYGKRLWQVFFLSHHEYLNTYQDEDWKNKLYQGYVSIKPSSNLTLELGKKSFLWGKGYAWNPAGFINRTKDPDDPELNLEGRTVLGLDYIKSFSGSSLNNLAFTALMLPVVEDFSNSELGETGDWNLAAKLYLLWHDTDLDFIYFNGPEQEESLGFDFAKNLAENLEIHGEVGLKLKARHVLLDSLGNALVSEEDQLSYMAGVRYLNSHDTTFFLEYYHNGAGYSSSELDGFFAYQKAAHESWLATKNEAIMQRAIRATRPYYGQRNFGRHYLYFKASQKEPFDFLYLTAWLASVVNLEDLSFSLQPGVSWSPVTNLVLNFRLAFPMGGSGTEFGEKPDQARSEFWVRYYF
jgi:hypothetical protein